MSEKNSRPVEGLPTLGLTSDPRVGIAWTSSGKVVQRASDVTPVAASSSETGGKAKAASRTAVAMRLRLAPTQHAERTFRGTRHGCSSLVDGLEAPRNQLGDAHGQGKGGIRPASRRAELAVNLTGAMSLFLVEAWEAGQDENEEPAASFQSLDNVPEEHSGAASS